MPPTPPSDEVVEDFQRLYKKKTGMDLPPDEARDLATRLLALVAAVYFPPDKGLKLKNSTKHVD